MSVNRGKAFEAQFKADFLKTVPHSTIDRLYDSMSGYYAISNISDFIGYSKPSIFYLEVKSHDGNTFPLVNLTQYDKLARKVGIPGVRAGVVIWFKDRDKIFYVPIKTVTKLKEDNKKSINATTIVEEGYRVFEIPTEKKKVFLSGDYCILNRLEDGD